MRASYRQLQELIRSMNATLLRATPYGLGIEHKGRDYLISRKYRRREESSMEGAMFEGDAGECAAYLAGTRDALRDWIKMMETK